ncbi:MAG TPA: cob(I)yrinic acid a,c-diamide adenosyltransferase, partial [Anaerolineales bacterium]|nr:cob(I)yrinic acid a,c-diamide adenosyltransferase [Anaerolineales bacterium]
ELNSALGVALAHGLDPELGEMLAVIQNELFHLGSDLCFIEDDKRRFAIPQIEARHVERLEGWIDRLNDVVGPLANFILPGGSLGAAQLHVARTICRRAERDITTLHRQEPVGQHVNAYLNRLRSAVRDGTLREPAQGPRRDPVEQPRVASSPSNDEGLRQGRHGRVVRSGSWPRISRMTRMEIRIAGAPFSDCRADLNLSLSLFIAHLGSA